MHAVSLDCSSTPTSSKMSLSESVYVFYSTHPKRWFHCILFFTGAFTSFYFERLRKAKGTHSHVYHIQLFAPHVVHANRHVVNVDSQVHVSVWWHCLVDITDTWMNLLLIHDTRIRINWRTNESNHVPRMAHVWMVHGSHMNITWHMYRWVMSMWYWCSTVWCDNVDKRKWIISRRDMRNATHMNESCLTCDWIMIHKWVSHAVHMSESCPSKLVCCRSMWHRDLGEAQVIHSYVPWLIHIATHWDTLQHISTNCWSIRCNTLQSPKRFIHICRDSFIPQHTITHYIILITLDRHEFFPVFHHLQKNKQSI